MINNIRIFSTITNIVLMFSVICLVVFIAICFYYSNSISSFVISKRGIRYQDNKPIFEITGNIGSKSLDVNTTKLYLKSEQKYALVRIAISSEKLLEYSPLENCLFYIPDRTSSNASHKLFSEAFTANEILPFSQSETTGQLVCKDINAFEITLSSPSNIFISWSANVL